MITLRLSLGFLQFSNTHLPYFDITPVENYMYTLKKLQNHSDATLSIVP